VKTVSLEDFMAQATALYGDDPAKWKFKCPRCGEVQSAEDLVAAGVDKDDVQKYMGFSCIGRFTDDKGCDWTLGGLFRLHELEIVDEEGNHHPYFDLAEQG